MRRKYIFSKEKKISIAIGRSNYCSDLHNVTQKVSPTEGEQKREVFLKETRNMKTRREMNTLFRRSIAIFH
jgi:hypothetical protein